MRNPIIAAYVILVTGVSSSFCEGANRTLQEIFNDAKIRYGIHYRDVVTELLSKTDAEMFLRQIDQAAIPTSIESRISHILLARLEHASVFEEYQDFLFGFRNQSSGHGQHGFLVSQALRFIHLGPENKFVAVGVGWEPLSADTNRQTKIIMRQRKYVQQEKYTEAEVKAGIARNAAARQAVLEHFLKFLDEGDAYEQSEMVELVCRLWGRDRIKRTSDLAVIDNVPDADALIEAVLKDGSRPEAARMRAAYCLPDSKRVEVRTFMMSVVTNNPVSHRQSYDVVGKALAYLESSADASDLAVLKSQTNAPSWKRDQIMKASRSIESRLSAATDEK